MLYGTLTEFCTPDLCPIMSAGPRYEYHWMDGVTVKKPLKCSAPGPFCFLLLFGFVLGFFINFLIVLCC